MKLQAQYWIVKKNDKFVNEFVKIIVLTELITDAEKCFEKSEK